jgi:Tol biopolymer transport system component
MTATGKLVFAGRAGTPYLWSLPLDANRGRPLEATRVLMPYSDFGLHTVSADGRRLAFLAGRHDAADVWLRDLPSGRAAALSTTPSIEDYPVMAPDGSALLYRSIAGDQADNPYSVDTKEDLYSIGTDGSIPKKLCANCGAPTDWSADKRYILLQRNYPHGRIDVRDLATGTQAQILAHDRHAIYRAHLSPDGRWIVFHAAEVGGPTREFVAPFSGTTAIGEREWIAITDGQAVVDAPRFSPDGNLIYFISEQDGFRCVWAQRLDAQSKKPEGRPFAVQHLHGRYRLMTGTDSYAWRMDLSVARNMLVFNVGELRGNIWSLDLRRTD